LRPILKSKENGNIFTEQWIQEANFMLSENRDAHAAKRFFEKALTSPHNQLPRVIKSSLPPASSAIERREDYQSRNIATTTKIS
jgi:transposase-like protein